MSEEGAHVSIASIMVIFSTLSHLQVTCLSLVQLRAAVVALPALLLLEERRARRAWRAREGVEGWLEESTASPRQAANKACSDGRDRSMTRLY